jgi:hypothetical protein
METNFDGLRGPDILGRLKGKVVSRDKMKQSAKMRQRMRFALLSNWEAKEKRWEAMLRMGHHPSTCWRVGRKIREEHNSPLVESVRLAPSDNRKRNT